MNSKTSIAGTCVALVGFLCIAAAGATDAQTSAPVERARVDDVRFQKEVGAIDVDGGRRR